MRLDLSGPLLESLTGKRESFFERAVPISNAWYATQRRAWWASALRCEGLGGGGWGGRVPQRHLRHVVRAMREQVVARARGERGAPALRLEHLAGFGPVRAR
jgi:hypothetical protein